MRVRHLVTHTSGMEHWDGRPGFAASDPGLEPARLRLLLEAPLRQAPGAAFHDSGPGYLVLGAVLSAAAGQPYRELVEQLVTDPLGLHGTSVGAPRPGPRALGYRGGTPVDSCYPARMPGTGGIWTTAPDIARLVSALHGGSLLPRAVLAELHVPLPVSPGARLRAHAYGAGHVLGTVDGRPARLHPGDDPGHRVLALWYPQTATTVVVVSNDEEDDLATIALDDRTTR